MGSESKTVESEVWLAYLYVNGACSCLQRGRVISDARWIVHARIGSLQRSGRISSLYELLRKAPLLGPLTDFVRWNRCGFDLLANLQTKCESSRSSHSRGYVRIRRSHHVRLQSPRTVWHERRACRGQVHVARNSSNRKRAVIRQWRSLRRPPTPDRPGAHLSLLRVTYHHVLARTALRYPQRTTAGRGERRRHSAHVWHAQSRYFCLP